MPKSPTPQAISRLLKAAGFDRSGPVSQSARNGRQTAGFHVRGGGAGSYAGWRPATPLLIPSAVQAERDRATAAWMAGKYAEAIRAAGWTAEVIHLAGPVVRVTAKEAPEATAPAEVIRYCPVCRKQGDDDSRMGFERVHNVEGAPAEGLLADVCENGHVFPIGNDDDKED